MSDRFPPPNLTYLGSFATPNISECTNSLGAICPSEDGNLWISGREGQNQLYVVKHNIVEDLKPANSSLTFATKITSQTWTNPVYFIPNKSNNYTRLAGIYEHNGWLIWIKRDFYYQQSSQLFPFIGATRISDGYTIGPFYLGQPYNGENLETWPWHPMKAAGTISKTPAEVASKLGYNPNYCFTIGHHNSSGTKGTSAGPSCYIFEFNPDNPPLSSYIDKASCLLYYFSLPNGNVSRWHGDLDISINKDYCLNVVKYNGANRFRAQCWINEHYFLAFGSQGLGTGWYGAQSYFDTEAKITEEGFNHPDFIRPAFPITGNKGYHADPYIPVILAYRASDMFNSIEKYRVQPISVTSLKEYFRFDGRYPAGGDYDITGATVIGDRLYLCNPNTVIAGFKELPSINVFKIG